MKKVKKNRVPPSITELKTWAYIFKVLGDEIRLNIIKEIVENPGISGKEILINLKLNQPTLSFHLKHLENARIIEYKKSGQTHCYFPDIEMISAYCEIVMDACNLVKTNILNTNKNK